MVPWHLTALCRPHQGRCLSCMCSQLGAKQEMMEGLAMVSVSPHLCQAAVSWQGDNSRIRSKTQQTFSCLHPRAAHEKLQWNLHEKIALEDWNAWSQCWTPCANRKNTENFSPKLLISGMFLDREIMKPDTAMQLYLSWCLISGFFH